MCLSNPEFYGDGHRLLPPASSTPLPPQEPDFSWGPPPCPFLSRGVDLTSDLGVGSDQLRPLSTGSSSLEDWFLISGVRSLTGPKRVNK